MFRCRTLLACGVSTLMAAAACGEEQRAAGSSSGDGATGVPAAGRLVFTASGGDLVRQGFVSSDGWTIDFDEAWVHVSGVVAMRTDPPYDPHLETIPDAPDSVTVEGSFDIDLASGDETGAPIAFASQAGAPAGHYNAIAWTVQPAPAGKTAPNAIRLTGTATGEGDTLSFEIGLDLACEYYGGEYVGDVSKGILQGDGEAEVEMTFHLDRLFGDAELPSDDPLNEMAVGFGPFAELAEEGVVSATMTELAESMSPESYSLLLEVLPTIGYVGEGHCYVVPLTD